MQIFQNLNFYFPKYEYNNLWENYIINLMQYKIIIILTNNSQFVYIFIIKTI